MAGAAQASVAWGPGSAGLEPQRHLGTVGAQEVRGVEGGGVARHLEALQRGRYELALAAVVGREHDGRRPEALMEQTGGCERMHA